MNKPAVSGLIHFNDKFVLFLQALINLKTLPVIGKINFSTEIFSDFRF